MSSKSCEETFEGIRLIMENPVSKYFDADWYLEINPDVAAHALDPFEHYVAYGAAEGRAPNPFFDPGWYLDANPDVKLHGKEPFLHYVMYGSAEGRDPNPFFSTIWYKTRYLTSDAVDVEPLLHFLKIGQYTDLDPSPLFDTNWYSTVNPDLEKFSKRPFEHFLRFGRGEDRDPNPYYLAGQPVTDAELVCVRAPGSADEIALFVTHSADGRLKPHVEHHLSSLHRQGIATVLIVAADVAFVDEDKIFSLGVSGLIVRQNIGFDFAAWAHAFALYPDLYDRDVVYLINDSAIGPFNDRLFEDIIRNIRSSTADVIGLTDSYEQTWHIQSYFVAFKRAALVSHAVRNFFSLVVSHTSKNRVIKSYELRFAKVLSSQGLSCVVLFQAEQHYKKNPHVYLWRSLIDRGFPFIKITTIRDPYPDLDTKAWRSVASSLGYDTSMVDAIVAERNLLLGIAPDDLAAPCELEDHQIFSAEAYVALNPDVEHNSLPAYEHYMQYGRGEGREVQVPGIDAIVSRVRTSGDKQTILLVSHEAVRGGAPVLVFNLVRELKARYDVVVLFLNSGPIIAACRDEGASIIGPIPLAGRPRVADYIIKTLISRAPIEFAIVNTVASRFILRALAKHYVPSLSLVHEFASYMRPLSAFSDIVFWSGRVVFSADLTRDDAIAKCPGLKEQTFPVIPQGVCFLPQTLAADTRAWDVERARIDAAMRSDKTSTKASVVVIGAGNIEYRKGVDLFVECAARIAKMDASINWRFLWVGRGLAPDRDPYAMFLLDQVDRSGLGRESFAFLDEIEDLETIYKKASVFLLTSRLDPLPNVALDSFAMSLPIVCFDRASGIADVLRKNGLANTCVARYLDTQDMADKAVALARSVGCHDDIAQKLGHIARETFSMARYAAEIEALAVGLRDTSLQEGEDTRTIAASEFFDLDYYFSGQDHDLDRADAARIYVRSWKVGLDCRKPHAGFHPGIYADRNGLAPMDGDAFAHYIRSGCPSGAWCSPVIRPTDEFDDLGGGIRAALHIHCYYPDIIDAIVWRLRENAVRPDLFITVPEFLDQDYVRRKLDISGAKIVRIDTVPNLGRDLGPFFTGSSSYMAGDYDIIGHIHTKKTADIADPQVGRRWYKFLLEHLIGGRSAMMDQIFSTMAANPHVGMVLPDDPHVVGWTENERFGREIWQKISSSPMPDRFLFPIGSMFWARPQALRPLFDLGLSWSDYPEEPLPYDGSMVHALERLLGAVVEERGFEIWSTSIAGVGR